MTIRRATVFVPATVANVACGFDILGFALSQPGDELTAERVTKPGVTLSAISGDGGVLPHDPARNTATVAAAGVLQRIEADFGLDLKLTKKMPLGSGLGSSAASAAAGAFAANLVAGSPLTAEELVAFAIEGERVACGSAHADNVAPALLGGFVLIRSYDPLDLVRLSSPPGLYCAVVHPHISIRTEDARKILRKQIALKAAIVQWGNIAGLIAGLLKNDLALVARSLQDVIVEPERALLIPGFAEVKAAALSAGALGCSISGSGPSVFALCDDEQRALAVAETMRSAFARHQLSADVFVSAVDQRGPRILSAE